MKKRVTSDSLRALRYCADSRHLSARLPVKIDTTVTATEYRLDDPAYAVEHTVTIQRPRCPKSAGLWPF